MKAHAPGRSAWEFRRGGASKGRGTGKSGDRWACARHRATRNELVIAASSPDGATSMTRPDETLSETRRPDECRVTHANMAHAHEMPTRQPSTGAPDSNLATPTERVDSARHWLASTRHPRPRIRPSHSTPRHSSITMGSGCRVLLPRHAACVGSVAFARKFLRGAPGSAPPL